MKKKLFTPVLLVLMLAICSSIFLSWKSLTKTQIPKQETTKIFATPPQEITYNNARQFFKNHRKDRKFVNRDMSGHERDTNKKEGYFDLTSDQVQEILEVMQSKGFAKTRIYFGSNGGTSYLIINGFDSAGNEIVPSDPSTETLSTVAIGGSSDCPKYCDVTKTALYAVPN